MKQTIFTLLIVAALLVVSCTPNPSGRGCYDPQLAYGDPHACVLDFTGNSPDTVKL
jgi:hypothetical protein